MTCVTYQRTGGITFICVSPFYRLRLDDGGYVFMDWHYYCGPTFYRDRLSQRPIEEWWEVPAIVRAMNWFVGRGKRA